MASKALLALTMSLPAAMAASVACFAGPSWPPMTSINTSMSSRLAKVTGSSSQAYCDRSTPRSLVLDRAETATISTGRPARVASKAPCFCTIRTIPTPTVPSPAIPRRRGVVMCLNPSLLSFRTGLAKPRGYCNAAISICRRRAARACKVAMRALNAASSVSLAVAKVGSGVRVG